MLSKTAQDNLKKDKRVLGRKWQATYGGFFSDRAILNETVKIIADYIDVDSPDVLYVGSANGALGERLVETIGGTLTLVDISEKHLSENKNPKTNKIVQDMLTLDLDDTFDVILMRSSLDYFSNKKDQIQVLHHIKKHLRPNGVFFNIPAYIPNLADRDMVSQIYTDTPKIGSRLFQSTDMEELYVAAGFSTLERIADGSQLEITEADHKQRYHISSADISQIQSWIDGDSSYVQQTVSGYTLRFDFPIFLSK